MADYSGRLTDTGLSNPQVLDWDITINRVNRTATIHAIQYFYVTNGEVYSNYGEMTLGIEGDLHDYGVNWSGTATPSSGYVKMQEKTVVENYNTDGTIANACIFLNAVAHVQPLPNISNGHIKVNNVWKNAFAWMKILGVWKRCTIWMKINGVWKRGK